MNGQLLLLKLAEMLILVTNCRIVQYNTDGIFVYIKRDQLDKANSVIKDFEELSRLSMEAEEFEAFYQYAINDYLAIHKGYTETKDPKFIKTKGLFINKTSLGKGMAPMIIPTAIQDYFIKGITPEETIKKCNDITQFCTYQKVDKKFIVLYDGKPITHINRYYMSTNGKRLTKVNPNDSRNPTALCADSGVTLYNMFDDIDIKDRNINYRYYIKECYKIINQMETQQLSLF